MKLYNLFFFILTAMSLSVNAQQTDWPEIRTESRPGARWWWMGSAVDRDNLTYNLEEYARAGLGALEITPIYGVQGMDDKELRHLSDEWMEMIRHTLEEGERLGLQIDMNTGTGWPFGGPEVSIEDAASRLLVLEYQVPCGSPFVEKIPVADKDQPPYARLERMMAFPPADPYGNPMEITRMQPLDLTDRVQPDGTLDWKAPYGEGEWRLIAAFCGKTLQKVKRAAPGGEGYVMDHLSVRAVSNYLQRFEEAFSRTATPYPDHFFNDSYEVYGANWTEGFFDEFARRRGYPMEMYLPEFLDEKATREYVQGMSQYNLSMVEKNRLTRDVIADYRETMAELLLENFTRQWTDWAHRHGVKTRNQAHGSPGNLIDLYATVDVPECEGFGITDFGIRGLRKDSLTRPNDSDLTMLKYASSAAHIAGKPYTSAETFTWLTEHFRTSLSQCKPEIDLLFVSGVNRAYFHGTTYSPWEAEWPGWKFYATVDMSPTNPIWRDAPAFFDYISRCQSFLQMGEPDNDFLLYLPVYDMWAQQDGTLLMFDIHKMARRAPEFIATVHTLYNAGYDMDYISDRFVRDLVCRDGKLITSAGTVYKGLIVPRTETMPEDVAARLVQLAQEGATIVFLNSFPHTVPGMKEKKKRETVLKEIFQWGDVSPAGMIYGYHNDSISLAKTGILPERMKSEYGLHMIRRSNPEGHHYFISALCPQDTDGWIPLAVPAISAMLYDPMTGEKGKARLRQRDGQAEVYLQLASGESVILRTYTGKEVGEKEWNYFTAGGREISLDGMWQFRFVESVPEVTGAPAAVSLGSWTELSVENAARTMATACYSTTFRIDDTEATDWVLDLGDVRESARVRINGEEVAVLFAVPYRCRIGSYLRPGENIIEIEVTNLPANRIADMDRRGVPWRKFKEINLVDIHYKSTGYGHWQPVASGLLGPVKICTIY
ncbi:MAG: glycosyl hydrolase family 2 [Bacteroides sp.]|nr:glycosyl hydrolase family 2 [Bacteroides sp.]